MNSLFIDFRDPLFSIIIFFSIVFVVAFASYWWNRYKHNEDSKYLDKFLKDFNSHPSKDDLRILISGGELSEKSWLLLAQSYSKTGDYEKSIEIYNEMLKLANRKNTPETMFLLGKTYFKAGFLERSKRIFLEILKSKPRTPAALNYLLLVYEYMKDFKSAQDVLEPLDELGVDIRLESAYLNAMELLNRLDISQEEKAHALLKMYQEQQQLFYLTYEYLFRINPPLAWKNFDASKSNQLADLLWGLEAKELDLDIISQNSFLRELYTARGDISLSNSSDIFEFDVLIGLGGKSNATLSFEYVCSSCKQLSPFVFTRCSSCHGLDTSRLEWSLVKNSRKDFSEENNSFQ